MGERGERGETFSLPSDLQSNTGPQPPVVQTSVYRSGYVWHALRFKFVYLHFAMSSKSHPWWWWTMIMVTSVSQSAQPLGEERVTGRLSKLNYNNDCFYSKYLTSTLGQEFHVTLRCPNINIWMSGSMLSPLSNIWRHQASRQWW